VALFPEDGPPLVLGRDDEASADRVRFFRQRPATLVPCLPLTAPGLSRRQLAIRPRKGGGLAVENVGKCQLFVNGERTDNASVGHGDVVYLKPQLLLLCVERPALIPAVRRFPLTAYRGFGDSDALGIVGESPGAWSMRETLPSLSERLEDIPLLLRHVILVTAERNPRVAGRFVTRDSEGRPGARIEPALVEYALRNEWPTNTRGLDGLLWRAMGDSADDVVVLPLT
jgi:hypothetical protein